MSVTLTGCVDFTTGKIVLDDDTCQWQTCMIFGGTHAGQVALTPNTIVCPDTYYGCVDLSTSIFEIIVPESCCAEVCNNCSVGTTPATITVKISGASNVSCWNNEFGCTEPTFFASLDTSIDDLAGLVNGVEKELIQSSIFPCVWLSDVVISESINTYIVDGGPFPGCDLVGPATTNPITALRWSLSRSATAVSIGASFVITGDDGCAYDGGLGIITYSQDANDGEFDCFSGLGSQSVTFDSFLSGGSAEIISQTGV